jgi:hypothetical protein
MIGAIIFLMLIGAGVFKMVYDHQIYKDLEKIRQFQNKTNEDVEQDLY